jgi:hypothetical protein
MNKKVCSKCNIQKSIDKFQKCKGYKDGYQNWCKTCKYENTRRWLKADSLRQRKAYEAQKRWYEENGREYHTQWREENRERVREINRRSVAHNLEKRREGYRRRREQIRGASSDITVKWLKELQNITTNCELCEVELLYETTQHDHHKANLDHIIPLNVGGTHTRDNVRYICYLCNLRRPKNGSDLL